MAKVFVSSTFVDLRECREKVRLVLQQLRHTDVAMETYVAEPERPVDKCLADVAQSDLYIGIFAWRYGYVPQGQDRSITELEYRTAVQRGKDCLIFMLDEEVPWPPKYIDDDKRNIRRFRDELAENQLCGFFGTPDQLASLVSTAVANWSAHRTGARSGNQGLPPPVIAAYARRLQQQYGRLDLDALAPPADLEDYLQIQLRTVFVEPSVREDPPPVELPKELWEKLEVEGEISAEDLPDGFDWASLQKAQAAYQARPLRRVLDVLAEDAGQHAVVLGDPGAGKSSLARYLALSVLEAGPDSRIGALQGYLPLLIELRTYARVRAERKAETFVEFLGYLAETEGYRFNKEQLEALLNSDGRALVIFDGLDELFDPADRELAAERIAGFAARYPAARILVTSRVVGYRRGILTNSGFEHYTLQDLSDEQVGAFLTTWYGLAFHGRDEDARERRQRLLDAMAESRSIRELAGNPMLLTILAIIGKGQELPRERWKLYDHAATVLVQHWDVNKHLRDERVEADFIGEDDKKELLRRVANRMQAGAAGLAGNHLPADQLQAEFESYLRDRYQRDPASAKVIAAAMIRQFHERNFILSRYGAGVYGFVHRAFLEFFCADFYVQQFVELQVLSIAELKQQVFAVHWADSSWREVLRLITGRIAARFAGQIIQFLSRDAYQPWPEKFGDRPPRNIALAVQCLGEVRSPNAIRKEATELLGIITKLLEHCIGTQDRPGEVLLEEELVPAIRSVGKAWPGREFYQQWYQIAGAFWVQVPIVNVAARIAGILLPDSQALRDMLENLALTNYDHRRRAAGVAGLAEGWPGDPDTRELLYRLARKDKHRMVRQTAMIAISDRWPSADATFSLLYDRAAQDPAKDVCQAALLALTDGWPSDDRVVTLLAVLALRKSDPDIGETALRRLRADPAARGFLVDRSASHADANERGTAVAALSLAWPGDPETFALLRDRASDPEKDVCRTALIALANIWGDQPETFALLHDWANDRNVDIRRAAVTVLSKGWADQPETLTVLHDRVRDSNGDVRLAAVTALGNARADDPKTLTLLRGRVNDRDKHVREAAVRALGNGPAIDPETFTVLSRRVNDPFTNVRQAAISVLGKCWAGDPETFSLLTVCAADVDWEVREAAVTALGTGWAGDQEAFVLLCDRVSDPNEDVRRAAVTALGVGWAGDKVAFALLRGWAIDRRNDLRRAAVTALGTGWAGDREAFALLTGCSGDPQEIVRWAAVTALGAGWAGDREAFVWLRSVANNRYGAARRAAITALGTGWAGDPETFSLLRRQASDSDSQVRWAVVTMLGRGWAGDPEAFSLMQRASGRDVRIRGAVITALGAGWAGDPEALILLRHEVSDPGHYIREAAVAALGAGWAGDPEALSLLRDRAGNDPFPYVRLAATDAILRSAAIRSADLLAARDR